MFRLLLLNAIVPSIALNCYKCATPGLKANWALTGFLTPPTGQVYNDECATLQQIPSSACATGPCIEMVFPLADAKHEFLRGCYDDFLKNAPTGSKALDEPIVPDALGDPNQLCHRYDVSTFYVNGTNAVNLCQASDDTPCNNYLKLGNVNSAFVLTPAQKTLCKEQADMECQQCQYFDGDGGCSPSTNNPSRGPACAKIRGTLAGRTYEERSPTYILPYDASGMKDCFDISGKKNLTLHFGALPGTTSFRSKRSVAPVFKGTMCYCTGTRCNGSPMMASLPATILLVLTAAPFFS